ncbi:hypothetical protein BGX28_003197 [Mortierella sp. GBA30]|nr:hypothetical protein BGX28_003197 [Mortierella sp. GBA30]
MAVLSSSQDFYMQKPLLSVDDSIHDALTPSQVDGQGILNFMDPSASNLLSAYTQGNTPSSFIKDNAILLPKKPHYCPWPNCYKVFTRSAHLARHVRSHGGEKPYACPHEGCGKQFSRSDVLKEHTRIHDVNKVRKRKPKRHEDQMQNAIRIDVPESTTYGFVDGASVSVAASVHSQQNIEQLSAIPPPLRRTSDDAGSAHHSDFPTDLSRSTAHMQSPACPGVYQGILQHGRHPYADQRPPQNRQPQEQGVHASYPLFYAQQLVTDTALRSSLSGPPLYPHSQGHVDGRQGQMQAAHNRTDSLASASSEASSTYCHNHRQSSSPLSHMSFGNTPPMKHYHQNRPIMAIRCFSDPSINPYSPQQKSRQADASMSSHSVSPPLPEDIKTLSIGQQEIGQRCNVVYTSSSAFASMLSSSMNSNQQQQQQQQPMSVLSTSTDMDELKVKEADMFHAQRDWNTIPDNYQTTPFRLLPNVYTPSGA